jgi:adenine-specific DNA-methyltransferase
MGNKHSVAPFVAAIAGEEDPGRAFVDAFSGMCSVAGAVAGSGRRVICNDIQGYAALVARCLVATPESPPTKTAARNALAGRYQYNRRRLADYFDVEVEEEDRVLARADLKQYQAAHERWRHSANDSDVAQELFEFAQESGAARYCLASLTFSWGYFGLRQSIAIDSIRYSIDQARADGSLSAAESDWAMVALLQAASCASASPGHFAQFLRPTSESGFRRILSQRRRNLWTQFLHEISLLRGYGDRSWRDKNAVLQADALSLGSELDKLEVGAAVIYADPPYSTDHYSRYYHVLETLYLYDFPLAEGAGRYRPDRFATPFSIKTKVEGAMNEFCSEVAGRGFTLVLSYPSSGLLNNRCHVDLDELLLQHFDSVERRLDLSTSHSTLGARHGPASNPVEEMLWVARMSEA